MSKHTPGPWRATWTHGTRCAIHCGAYMSQGVVSVVHAAGNDGDFSKEASEANAALIAAAPDLLDAVEEALKFLMKPVSQWKQKNAYTAIDKLIAARNKAKGEDQS